MPTPQRLTTRPALAAAAILALAPACAWANGIMVVVGFTAIHLFFGNFLIGILEGVLISWKFRTPGARSIPIMIAANYVSAILGYIVYMQSFHMVNVDRLLNYPYFLTAAILMTTGMFALTLLIEYPFVHFTFAKDIRTFRKSLMALLLANAVSYTGIIGYYWMVSNTSLIREFTLVPAEQMEAPEDYALFYISPDRMSVMRSDLLGHNAETIHTLEQQANQYGDRLFARPTEEGTYDLYLLTREKNIYSDLQILIQEDFAAAAPIEYGIRLHPENMPVLGTYRPEEVAHMDGDRNWTFRAPLHLSASRLAPLPDQPSRFTATLDTLFWPVPIGSASQIEGDFLIFQFGSDSILILQPDSRKLARLTHGQGPLAAKMRPADDQP